MWLLSLLIYSLQARPVMGLSGLSCPPFSLASILHDDSSAFDPLTSSSIWAITITTAVTCFSFQSDALQPCCACRGLEHEYYHTPPTRLEWAQLKGHEEGGVAEFDCKYPQGAPVDIQLLNFNPSSVFVFPVLDCQNWHVNPKGPKWI